MNNHTTTRYERIATPAPMRFQARDGAILQALHTYDGVLARRQIKDMFWKEASTKTMERRLTLLYHNGFINMPSLDQRRVYPIPEPIVWLGWRGILHVANQLEVDIDDPLSSNENQLRMLEKKLRQARIKMGGEASVYIRHLKARKQELEGNGDSGIENSKQ